MNTLSVRALCVNVSIVMWLKRPDFTLWFLTINSFYKHINAPLSRITWEAKNRSIPQTLNSKFRNIDT